jgi:hypothetical protein
MSRQFTLPTATPGRCVAPSPATLANPNMVVTNGHMAGFVTAMRAEGKRKNTALAFGPKMQEFEEFCEYVYPQDPYKYTIDSEKCYRFMFYTAFMEKKPTGKRKSKLEAARKMSRTMPNLIGKYTTRCQKHSNNERPILCLVLPRIPLERIRLTSTRHW